MLAAAPPPALAEPGGGAARRADKGHANTRIPPTFLHPGSAAAFQQERETGRSDDGAPGDAGRSGQIQEANAAGPQRIDNKHQPRAMIGVGPGGQLPASIGWATPAITLMAMRCMFLAAPFDIDHLPRRR